MLSCDERLVCGDSVAVLLGQGRLPGSQQLN
jgi:hypothetical protein